MFKENRMKIMGIDIAIGLTNFNSFMNIIWSAVNERWKTVYWTVKRICKTLSIWLSFNFTQWSDMVGKEMSALLSSAVSMMENSHNVMTRNIYVFKFEKLLEVSRC